MTEQRFRVIGKPETVVNDNQLRPCPKCSLSAMWEIAIWDEKRGGVRGEVELVGYDRKCLNEHQWTDTAYSNVPGRPVEAGQNEAVPPTTHSWSKTLPGTTDLNSAKQEATDGDDLSRKRGPRGLV